MLPGPDRLGKSQRNGFPGCKRANAVGDQPILRPIAAADDIACARGGDRRSVGKEAVAKTHRHQLRTGLAVAVGIMAAETIGFDERPAFIMVFVHFVARHDEHAFQLLESPAGLQQDGGAEHVGRVRRERVAIRLAHQRLGGHVNHDLRIRADQCIANFIFVANIGDVRMRAALHDAKHIGLSGRRQGVTRHLCAQGLQPEVQPCALETGVPGQKHAPIPPKLAHDLCDVYPAFRSQ